MRDFSRVGGDAGLISLGDRGRWFPRSLRDSREEKEEIIWSCSLVRERAGEAERGI